jgi:hypothetical protein
MAWGINFTIRNKAGTVFHCQRQNMKLSFSSPGISVLPRPGIRQPSKTRPVPPATSLSPRTSHSRRLACTSEEGQKAESHPPYATGFSWVCPKWTAVSHFNLLSLMVKRPTLEGVVNQPQRTKILSPHRRQDLPDRYTSADDPASITNDRNEQTPCFLPFLGPTFLPSRCQSGSRARKCHKRFGL